LPADLSVRGGLLDSGEADFGKSARGRATRPDDPAAELASFQPADGFEVNLFASEKDA
jgi:hypothetical protein